MNYHLQVWTNCFGPGYSLRVWTPILLILSAAILSLVSALLVSSLILFALSMTIIMELFVIYLNVHVSSIRAKTLFRRSEIKRFTLHTSNIMFLLSVLVPVWVIGLLFIRTFNANYIGLPAVLLVSPAVAAIIGVAVALLNDSIFKALRFDSKLMTFKKLIIPCSQAFLFAALGTLTDLIEVADDIGALTIVFWYASSTHPENINV